MKNKTKDLHIRIDEDTARYIDLAVSYHHCTKTNFVTKQILRPEFYELRFENIKPLSSLMGNISNNINQIARAINTLKKDESKKMTTEQFAIIEESLREVRKLFGEHDEEYRKCLLRYYKVTKESKVRTIGEMEAIDVSDVANENEVDKNGND